MTTMPIQPGQGIDLNFNADDIKVEVTPRSLRLIQSRYGEQIEVGLVRNDTGEKLLTWINRNRGAQLAAIKSGLLVVTDGKLFPSQKLVTIVLTSRGKVLWKDVPQ